MVLTQPGTIRETTGSDGVTMYTWDAEMIHDLGTFNCQFSLKVHNGGSITVLIYFDTENYLGFFANRI